MLSLPLFPILACAKLNPIVVSEPAFNPADGLARTTTSHSERSILGISEDLRAYPVFVAIEQGGDLAAKRSAEELASSQIQTSQTFIAAIVPEEYTAGIVYGNPWLVELACNDLTEVNDATLFRVADLDDVTKACARLKADAKPEDGACGDARKAAREAWSHLLAENEAAGRAAAGRALDSWRACADNHAIYRSPAPPESLGFVTVVIAQILGIDDKFYLRGSAAYPSFASRVDATWRQLVAASRLSSTH